MSSSLRARFLPPRSQPFALRAIELSRRSTRDANFTFYCVEETVLVHEVGHAVLGDPDHTESPVDGLCLA